MKTKLFFFILPAVISGFIYFNTTKTASPPVNPPDNFIFSAMHSMIDRDNGYDNYGDIGLNSWHAYTLTDVGNFPGNPNRHTPKGSMLSNDRLMTMVEDYDEDLKDIIEEVYFENDSRLIWQRPKIEWLCYGQSSIYQAEVISVNDPLWFYSFNDHEVGSPDHIDTSEFSGPVEPVVVFCSQSLHGEGFAVKRVKANTEQSHRITGTNADNHWMGDSECDWYVKPRVRADRNFIINPSNAESEIFKVYVKDQDNNDKITPVIIRAKHFQRNYQTANLYDGDYIDKFFFVQDADPTYITFTGDLGDIWVYGARGTRADDVGHPYKADFQVYWYDNCDMWLDYVKVENDVADELFKGNRDEWIQKEVDLIAEHVPPGASEPAVWKFYIELTEFNNLPCIAYVNEKLKYYSDNKIDMLIDLTNGTHCHVNWDKRNTVSNAEFLAEHYVNKVGLTQIFMESYPLTALYEQQQTFATIPNTLPTTSGGEILAVSESPDVYDEWLQDNLFKSPYVLESDNSEPLNFINREVVTCPSPWPWQDPGNFGYVMKIGNEISKIAEVPFIFMPQGGQWYTPGEVRREPTNEELDMMANVGVSYGAKGLIYYWFPSTDGTDPNCPTHSRGMLDPGNSVARVENVYEQDKFKWHTFRDIGLRMKAWESQILSFDNDNTNSYIYHIAAERTALLNNSYFSEVISYKTGNGLPPCTEDMPDTTLTGDAIPGGLRYECKEDRYLQVATFEKSTNDGNNYFMIVNRRCSPYRPEISEEGGRRKIQVVFNESHGQLAIFNNWLITDVASGDQYSFAKGTYQRVDLGWFNPGEGKLYKMVPKPRSGGILLADEHISGQIFTCEDTIICNGFDITIDEGSVVSFTDSATIIMNGGTFTSGVHGTGSSELVTYKGEGSGKWNGLRFNGTDVNIYNSKFQDIASPCVNYAISMVDCQFADIRTNQFILNTDTAGAIQSVYIEDPFGSPSYTGLHINYNSITMANSRGYGISVQGFSGITLPLYAGNNTMTSNGYATGILLSTITGGVVKNNSISGFSTGINTLFSTIDVYGNTISNTSSVSKGIIATGLSSSGLLPASGLWLGGMNTIENTSGASTNIEVNNSVFALEGGNNTFDVTSTTGAYHLYGTFWSSAYTAYHRNNCFKLGGTVVTSPANPNYSISNGFASITLYCIDYTCSATPPEDVTVVDLGNGLYDTIPYSGGGEMGSNYKTTPSAPQAGGHPSLVRRGAYTLSNTSLYDSIRIQIRKKQYIAAKESCYGLIDTYPDSSESISALSYLFLSQTTADTSQTAIGNLKSYYEGLILNHGNNTAMVTMCNYLVQKCKVKLHQYTSALSGFQEIISNNPYSYEGLLAKWDYMATSLLVGGSGGESEISDFASLRSQGLEIADSEAIDQLMGWNERTPFTKEERQTIRQSVTFANERVKNDREAKIKTLEERTKTGDKGSEKELRTLRTLKDINKSVKPANVFEHINIVSGDIQKVFATDVVISNKQENLIPNTFSLSQNYPNPFNPVTTIKYALPHDVKVVVKIYDILGREVKVLVNELQKAGYYDAKFDGSNFASGVYFYRIEAGDFVLAKKMVLIK